MNLSVLSDPGAADNPVKSDHVAPLLPKYKLPVEITILDDLPKYAVGKIAKRALRQWLASTHLPGHPTPPLNPPPKTHGRAEMALPHRISRTCIRRNFSPS